MADNDNTRPTQGLTESANPLADERLQGGPPPQAQEWPGTEEAMQPPAAIAPSYVFLASADGRYYTGDVFFPSGFEVTTR